MSKEGGSADSGAEPAEPGSEAPEEADSEAEPAEPGSEAPEADSDEEADELPEPAEPGSEAPEADSDEEADELPEPEPRFFCPECGRRFASRKVCDDCGDQALDSTDAEVVAVLTAEESERAARHRQRIVLAAVPLGILAGLGIGFGAPEVLAAIPLPIPFAMLIKIVVVMVLCAGATLMVGTRLWPYRRRFPFLIAEATPSLRRETGGMALAEAKRPLIAVGVIVALGAVVGAVAWWQHTSGQAAKARAEAAAAQAYSDLFTCAIGAPLAPGESLLQRVRRIRIADAPENAGWPGRCSAHATKLRALLSDKPSAISPLTGWLDEQLACQSKCNLDQPAVQLEGLWEAAQQSGLQLQAASAGVAPPKFDPGLRLIAKEELPQLTAADARLLQQQRLDNGTVWALFASRQRGLSLCEVAGGRLRCPPLGQLPIATTNSVGLVGNQGQEPLLQAVVRATAEGLQRAHISPSSREVVTTYESAGGGEVIRHGVALEHGEGNRYTVKRIRDGAVQLEEEIELAKGARSPWLLANQLAWVGSEKAANDLFTRPILPDEDKLLGKVVRVGAVGDSQRPFVCYEAGTARVALFSAEPRPRAGASVVFLQSPRWSSPVGVGEAEPEAEPEAKPEPEAEPLPPEPQATASAEPERPEQAASGEARRKALRDAAEFGMLPFLEGSKPKDGSTDPWQRAGEQARDALSKGTKGPEQPQGGLGDPSVWGHELGAPPPARGWSHEQQSFTCGEGLGVITWRQHGGGPFDEIHRATCTEQGCEVKVARLEGLKVESWWLATTLQNGKTLLVWRSVLGDVRLRLAKLEDLATAKDRPFLDANKHGGPATQDLQVLVSGDVAIFLFRGIGYHALRIDGEGNIEPLSPD